MNILITICARGGSKGIPGKNIKKIGGKPLIFYTVMAAKKFKNKRNLDNVDIVLSTDSEQIKSSVKNLDINEINSDYTRPAVLATDSSGKLDAVKDVKNYMETNNNLIYDYTIDLDVSSPLRTTDDMELALENLLLDEKAYNIFSVNVAHKNPYFNMVEKIENGYYNLSKKGEFFTRQSAPNVYEMNASFYIYSKSFFEQNCTSAITEKSLIFEMNHICFDLDNPIDFSFMEYLMSNNKLDFDF